MKINDWEILLRRKFVRQVDSAAEFIRKNTTQQHSEFVEELEEMIYEKIPYSPFSHPEFEKKRTKEKMYRRAIFRKKWNVIYMVSGKAIVFVYLYHSSRNIDNLKI